MIEITIFSVGTLLLLALAFTGIGVVAYVTYSYPGRIFQGLLLAIASVSVLSILLTGRVLRISNIGLETLMEGGEGGTFVGKAMLLILVGVAFGVCVAWGLWRFGHKRPPLRYTAAANIEINRLTMVFVMYYVAYSLLPLLFAPIFQFHVSLVYALFIWLALLLALRTSTVDPVLVVRQALGLIVLSSLAAAIFLPALALQPGYTSLIPGFDMRLWGVTASANTLGSVTGALLLMQFIDKPHRPLWHHLLTISALAALLLTQSKSAISGALFGLVIFYAWRIWRGNADRPANLTRIMIGTALLFFLGAFILGAIWLALSDPTIWSAMMRRLNLRAIGDISTFTGRTDIWDYAIRRGMETPLFGQGLSMWDLQTRLATGFNGAVHAHNQYLQTFSRAGFIGLAALLLLLAYIIRYALSASSLTSGGSLALLAMFLVRSITEVPLQPNSILGGEFFAFMALLVFTTDRALRNQKMANPQARCNVEATFSGTTKKWVPSGLGQTDKGPT